MENVWWYDWIEIDANSVDSKNVWRLAWAAIVSIIWYLIHTFFIHHKCLAQIYVVDQMSSTFKPLIPISISVESWTRKFHLRKCIFRISKCEDSVGALQITRKCKKKTTKEALQRRALATAVRNNSTAIKLYVLNKIKRYNLPIKYMKYKLKLFARNMK